jgi:hypothetical protein
VTTCRAGTGSAFLERRGCSYARLASLVPLESTAVAPQTSVRSHGAWSVITGDKWQRHHQIIVESNLGRLGTTAVEYKPALFDPQPPKGHGLIRRPRVP